MTRLCIGRMADDSRCQREPVPASPGGTAHAHCRNHEDRLLREAFGPVSWHDRARVGDLPVMVVGGISVPAGGALSPEGSARSDGQRGWARSAPAA